MAEIKRKVTPSKATPRESQLVILLSNDKQLGEDKTRLQLFLTLARMYDEDLKNNIFASSFELDDKYSTFNVNAWVEFKRYQIVETYTRKFIDEFQKTEALKTMKREGITKISDAINVQEIIEGKQKANKDTQILVFLLPQKPYTKV